MEAVNRRSTALVTGLSTTGLRSELNQEDEVSPMFNRVVSVCSFFMVILSVAAFGLGAWWTFIGRISVGDGVFLMSGWCVCALVFLYRAIDPVYLDPISIIKSR